MTAADILFEVGFHNPSAITVQEKDLVMSSIINHMVIGKYNYVSIYYNIVTIMMMIVTIENDNVHSSGKRINVLKVR